MSHKTPLSHCVALPILQEIETLVNRSNGLAQLFALGKINHMESELPLYAVVLGNRAPGAPTLGLFGGIHGVERIGTEVVLAYMHSLIEGAGWFDAIHAQLEQVRLVFMPLVNPGGMCRNLRCNPAGIDLMRNAPIDAEEKVPFLLGGQRISHHLPWYRGKPDEPMQIEAEAVCEIVEKYLLPSEFSIALDCHSGYGHSDYIWFPYAYSRRPFEHATEVRCLAKLFTRIYPNHTIYKIEPQSHHYTTHGDLWDHLYLKSETYPGTFLPLTLEMGSWSWIKKNPRQLFRFTNLFNPVLPHRHQRILRRHLILIEFLLKAVANSSNWIPPDQERERLQHEAVKRWYPDYA